MLGRADPVGVDRLDAPRVGLAAPAQEEFLGRGLALGDHVVRRRLVARRPWRAERATISIICAESRPRSSRACSSEISLSLPRFQTPESRAVSACRSDGAFPLRAGGSKGSGSGIAELTSSSTRRPQTFS